MNRVLGTGIAAILFAGQVFADSIVNYSIELAPYDPAYVAAWKANTNRIAFTPGNPADSQQFNVGDVITWDVVAALDPTGTHTQPNHPSNGKKPYGIANVVFNLEMTTANDQPVSTGAFFSAVNDGTAGDPIAAAAFAAVFTIATRGPGRLVDQVEGSTAGKGGPNMGLSTYPTAVPDKMLLLGHGAGYTQWERAGSTLASVTVPGVGLVTLPDQAGTAGLGIRPLFEGQIDTTGMAPGVYKLKVIPGAGVNVLRGDYTDFLTKDKEAFAVAVNQQNGDTISFTLVPKPVGSPPALVSAVSRKVHGAVGSFDIALPTVGAVGVEGRQNGPTTVVLTYDRSIGGTPTAVVTSTMVPSITSTLAITAANELTVSLPNAMEGDCISITINNVADALDPAAIAAAQTLKVLALFADVNGNGTVNSTDIGLIKSKSGLAVDASSFRMDVNANGLLNSADVAQVKSRSGVTAPSVCGN